VLLLGGLLTGLPALQRADPGSLLAWGAATLLGLLGLWLQARATEPGPAPASEHSGGPAGASTATGRHPLLPPLLQSLLPVWRRQITLAREHTEEAAGTLVADLSGLSAQFDAAGFGHRVGAHRRSQALLEACTDKLGPVVQAMGEIAAGHQEVVGSVRGMMTVTDELRGMADEVARIAQQTNLLAINAAIEAARAGEAGRGFSVVAAEVRRLSKDSADTAQRIAQRIEQVTAMMASTASAALQSAERDSRSIGTTSERVEAVLGHVRELGDDAAALIHQGQSIRTSIESLVVGLQFQDRVSQIIGAIEQDMARLGSAIEAGEALPTQRDWLVRLEQAYTMRDQRQPLAPGGGSAKGAAHPVAATPRAVFF
jgi:methyl-accepting chemotaxis protein